MFHFKEDVDWSWFFRFDKKWIENMNWARISTAAKAVLPVIACHCNERGEAFPGEEVIAGLSGRTEKIVRHGIIQLQGFPGFEWQHYLTQRGKQGKKFYLELPPKGAHGRAFFFHRGIMDGGIWRELKPTAQAIYPVMRHFARYDIEQDDGIKEDCDIEELSEFLKHYANRRWEICVADIGTMAHFAGIERHSVKDAMNSLENNFLLEPYISGNGEKAWKVFILPKKLWKASYLNKTLKRRR